MDEIDGHQTWSPVVNASVLPRMALKLKAQSLLAFVLTPREPVGEWLADVDHWLRGAPDFFVGRPVLLDVTRLELSREALLDLLSELSGRGIRVMGIDGVESAWLPMGMPPLISRARQAGMREITVAAGLTGAAPEGPECKETEAPAGEESAAAAARPTRIVEGPVRSGQSVIHPDGDVIVIGSIASGAEVIAGGSIHVYGTLRGRACAGTLNEETARIFCARLEAEFVSIGAVYITAETIDQTYRGKRVQARLDGVTIRFDLLS